VGAFVAGGGLVALIVAIAARGGSSDGASGGTSPSAAASSAPPAVTQSGGEAPVALAAPEQGGTPGRPPAAPPKGRINLLSSANGGHLMVPPNDSWRSAIDDNTTSWQYLQAGTGDGVYAFRDEQPATFDTFMMLIDETSPINIKEFELFAGNEAPLGAFDSIGKFQTQNIRLYPSPWQEFKFQPVRARFFKLHVISAWDAGWNAMPRVTEWQLLGSF
jgi:hypothetical protein